jgi:DNA invertase Pin-like site-specific DNA recombinase
MRVGIYTRLSKDDDGTETATARQEADARARADRDGYEIHRVYRDSDMSAYRKNVVRPGFDALLDDAVAGTIDAVLVWRIDRLARASRDWARVLPLVDDGGLRVIGVADGVDTATPGGRLTLDVLAGVARNESLTMSLRLKRKHQELAEQGRHSGGGRRPFGLTSDWSAIVEHEAELIQEAAGRVLSGEGIVSIARDFVHRGVPTASGSGHWTTKTLRKVLTSPRIAGIREYGGKTYEGQFPAIIAADTWRRVAAILLDPARRTTSDGKAKHLLTGVLRCATCDGTMVSRNVKGKRRVYACVKPPQGKGCGHVSVAGAAADAYVEGLILAMDFGHVLVPSDDVERERIVERITQLQAAMEELVSDYYVARALPREAFFATKDRLERELDYAKTELASASRESPLALVTGSIGGQWAEGSMDWRRNVVKSLLEITVAPAATRGRAFDPSRLELRWV